MAAGSVSGGSVVAVATGRRAGGATVPRLRRHVERRVPVEETERLEPERDRVHRHDRPVLGPGDVMQAEDVPEHDIGVDQRLVVGDPLGQPVIGQALGRIRSARPLLVVVVAGDPQRVTHHRRPQELRRRGSIITGKAAPGTSL